MDFQVKMYIHYTVPSMYRGQYEYKYRDWGQPFTLLSHHGKGIRQLRMTNQVKLVYFDLYGRGEAIRILLAAGKVKYEDYRIPGGSEEWPKLKPETPFGGVPVLHWDDEEIAQANAIIRFVAKNTGLAGADDTEFARADAILEHANDLFPKIGPLRFAKTQEDRVSGAFSFLGDFLPNWLSKAERRLQKTGGKWFSGSGLTFAEVIMQVHLFFIMDPEEAAFKDMNNKKSRSMILNKYPLLKANYERVQNVPEIAQWIKNRPAFKGL